MTITATTSPEQDEVTLHVSGRFDFSMHQEFIRAYKEFPKGEKRFIVDLKGADYMDSSAMGMLLQLREHGDKKAGVRLINSNDGIREILRIANFDKLFSID
jgi:anti-anti-sigma factor